MGRKAQCIKLDGHVRCKDAMCLLGNSYIGSINAVGANPIAQGWCAVLNVHVQKF